MFSCGTASAAVRSVLLPITSTRSTYVGRVAMSWNINPQATTHRLFRIEVVGGNERLQIGLREQLEPFGTMTHHLAAPRKLSVTASLPADFFPPQRVNDFVNGTSPY